jgi:hypothetical protein
VSGRECRCDNSAYWGHVSHCDRWMDGEEVLLRSVERAIKVLVQATGGHALTPWQRERCAQAGEVLRHLRYPDDPAPRCLDGFMDRAASHPDTQRGDR